MGSENYSREIRNKRDTHKIDFIESIISQKGIPDNFVPLPRSFPNKIFFKDDGEQREWISFENSTFFCAYCVCYSEYKNHRLIEGIKYEKGCRISEILKLHEAEKHHIAAKRIYTQRTSTCDVGEMNRLEDKRIVLKSIAKIIIFQATHGEFVLT